MTATDPTTVPEVPSDWQALDHAAKHNVAIPTAGALVAIAPLPPAVAEGQDAQNRLDNGIGKPGDEAKAEVYEQFNQAAYGAFLHANDEAERAANPYVYADVENAIDILANDGYHNEADQVRFLDSERDRLTNALAASEANVEEMRSSYAELADLAQRLADTPEGSASEVFLTWLDRCTDELRTIIGPMAPGEAGHAVH